MRTAAVPVTEQEFELYLLGALLAAGLRGRPSAWGPDRWREVLAPLPARYKCVVVWFLLGGMSQEQIGRQLKVTRSMAHQMYQSAVRKLSHRLRPEMFE